MRALPNHSNTAGASSGNEHRPTIMSKYQPKIRLLHSTRTIGVKIRHHLDDLPEYEHIRLHAVLRGSKVYLVAEELIRYVRGIYSVQAVENMGLRAWTTLPKHFANKCEPKIFLDFCPSRRLELIGLQNAYDALCEHYERTKGSKGHLFLEYTRTGDLLKVYSRGEIRALALSAFRAETAVTTEERKAMMLHWHKVRENVYHPDTIKGGPIYMIGCVAFHPQETDMFTE